MKDGKVFKDEMAATNERAQTQRQTRLSESSCESARRIRARVLLVPYSLLFPFLFGGFNPRSFAVAFFGPVKHSATRKIYFNAAQSLVPLDRIYFALDARRPVFLQPDVPYVQIFERHSSLGRDSKIIFQRVVHLGADRARVFWLARKFPIEKENLARNLAIHMGAAVAAALLHWELSNLSRHYVLGFPGSTSIAFVFHQNFLIYWILVGAISGYNFYERYREGELRSAQLSAQLSQAQLQSLRAQLHPHFLFNTLNSIAALVHRNPDEADRMIARFSDLLRISLGASGRAGSSARSGNRISKTLRGNRAGSFCGSPPRGFGDRSRNVSRSNAVSHIATASRERHSSRHCSARATRSSSC